MFLYCIWEPDGCTEATLVGAGGVTATNGIKAVTNPCFKFVSTTLKDLLVTAAGGLPGGVFDATAGRFGPKLGLGARRLLQTMLNGPGLGADAAHNAGSP